MIERGGIARVGARRARDEDHDCSDQRAHPQPRL
jgi:hypothetical protein